VVLPEPLGPSSVNSSPRATESSTPASATTVPNRRVTPQTASPCSFGPGATFGVALIGRGSMNLEPGSVLQHPALPALFHCLAVLVPPGKIGPELAGQIFRCGRQEGDDLGVDVLDRLEIQAGIADDIGVSSLYLGLGCQRQKLLAPIGVLRAFRNPE